jgi:WhiB family redox-sensing transcriptional regulator
VTDVSGSPGFIVSRRDIRKGRPPSVTPTLSRRFANRHIATPTELLALSGDPVDILTAEVGPSPLLAAILASIPSWHADALCAEFDLDPWFPTKGQSNQPALDICGRCRVRLECPNEALDDETLDHGIRGGMSANARKVARRSRAVESEAS